MIHGSISLRTSEIARDGELVVVRVHSGVKQSREDAAANIDAALELSGGSRRPILVDIRVCEPLEPDVRHLYSGSRLMEGFSALALLVAAGPFGQMMGNIYLRVARLGIPVRLFSNEEEARQWLSQFPST